MAGVAPLRPHYALTPAQYASNVLAVAVYPMMEGNRICLSPANEQAEEALERLRSRLQLLAPDDAPDAASWAVVKVRELLDQIFAKPAFQERDAWSSTMDDGQPLMVIKQAVLDAQQLSLEEAIRRVHRNMVAEALGQGFPVPSEVLREHQLAGDSAERDH